MFDTFLFGVSSNLSQQKSPTTAEIFRHIFSRNNQSMCDILYSQKTKQLWSFSVKVWWDLDVRITLSPPFENWESTQKFRSLGEGGFTNCLSYSTTGKVKSVKSIVHQYFCFIGKDLPIWRFQSWGRSQMKGLVVLHSKRAFMNFEKIMVF